MAREFDESISRIIKSQQVFLDGDLMKWLKRAKPRSREEHEPLLRDMTATSMPLSAVIHRMRDER